MIDRLFTATLTFCMLIGGTVAIGSAMLEGSRPAAAPQAASAPARIVQLERVVIVGKRLSPGTDVAQSDDAGAARVQ